MRVTCLWAIVIKLCIFSVLICEPILWYYYWNHELYSDNIPYRILFLTKHISRLLSLRFFPKQNTIKPHIYLNFSSPPTYYYTHLWSAIHLHRYLSDTYMLFIWTLLDVNYTYFYNYILLCNEVLHIWKVLTTYSDIFFLIIENIISRACTRKVSLQNKLLFPSKSINWLITMWGRDKNGEASLWDSDNKIFPSAISWIMIFHKISISCK